MVVSPVIIGGSLGAIPLVLFGLGVGSAANRLAFGVLFPVPPARRRRERAD